MYKCYDCHNVFEESGTRKEKVGLPTDSLPPGYLYYDCCPVCGSDDFTTVHFCENCENEITENVYCDKCKESAVKYMHELEKETNGQDVKGLLEEILEE